MSLTETDMRKGDLNPVPCIFFEKEIWHALTIEKVTSINHSGKVIVLVFIHGVLLGFYSFPTWILLANYISLENNIQCGKYKHFISLFFISFNNDLICAKLQPCIWLIMPISDQLCICCYLWNASVKKGLIFELTT